MSNQQGPAAETAGQRRAFTLVELLIALTVMLAIVSMAAGVFRENVDDSRIQIRNANLRALRKAIQTFYNDHGRYPYNGQDNFGNVVHFLDDNSCELVKGVHNGSNTYPAKPTRYLYAVPIDPTTGNADWILIPSDNDGDWIASRDDTDGNGKPSANDGHVDEDPFGNGDEDNDGKIDEDPPDVRDVASRGKL